MKIGIDPGISGALALLNQDNDLIVVLDMPVMAAGKTQVVNAAELGKMLDAFRTKARLDRLQGGEYQSVIVYLERVSAMPGQGVTGMFNFGMSYGIVRGAVGALQIPLILVTPAQWKRRAGLIGKEKDVARSVAQQLYPSAELGRKKDIGRADAILIARFGGED